MRTVEFGHPFREGTFIAVPPAEAAGRFDVAIEGHGYQLDLASQLFAIESLPIARDQQDTGTEAGEQTLASGGLWRRNSRSWHLGAGQSRGDEEVSSPYRYLSSKGVDPWTKWEVSLLNDTELVEAATGTPVGVVAAGSRVFVQDGSDISSSVDGDTWTADTTLPSAPSCIGTSDGQALYVASVDNIIRKVQGGGTVTTAWTLPIDAEVLAFAKGRMWAGAGLSLYPLTPGSAVTAEFTHPWTGWKWSAICEGPRAVYAAGYLGDKTQVYRIPFNTDGTGFDAAVVAATLPDGELVTAMTSYLGYILLGTSKGVRFGVPSAEGDLTYGPLIETPEPVRCFEPQDRFVWFGWSKYDSGSTGLGRMDLSVFTDDLTPAFSSDLMYSSQGDVTSVTTFGDRLLFTVEGVGVVAESTEKVAAGEMVLSDLTWGLYDKKVASVLSVAHEPLDGLVQVSLAVDDSSSSVIGESSEQGSTGPEAPIKVEGVRGVRFTLSLALSKDDGDGPVLTGLLFAVRPAPIRGKKFRLPLMLSEQPDYAGLWTSMDPGAEESFLTSLVELGAAVSVQIAGRTYSAHPMDFRFVPYKKSANSASWAGTFVIELDEVTT